MIPVQRLSQNIHKRHPQMRETGLWLQETGTSKSSFSYHAVGSAVCQEADGFRVHSLKVNAL
jgi:hypothetical protein